MFPRAGLSFRDKEKNYFVFVACEIPAVLISDINWDYPGNSPHWPQLFTTEFVPSQKSAGTSGKMGSRAFNPLQGMDLAAPLPLPSLCPAKDPIFPHIFYPFYQNLRTET